MLAGTHKMDLGVESLQGEWLDFARETEGAHHGTQNVVRGKCYHEKLENSRYIPCLPE